MGGSGVAYSGYTVFAGELAYDSPDNGEVGYKVYIGPNQYFVITDIGKGRYQYYAFLARDPGSAETEEKPDGTVPFLKKTFEGWSPDIHAILDATREDEIEQRDLYDRPPSSLKPWSVGPVGLLGDSVHAMMPNLGRGRRRGRLAPVRAGVGLRRRGSRWDLGDDLGLPRRRRGHALRFVVASLSSLSLL